MQVNRNQKFRDKRCDIGHSLKKSNSPLIRTTSEHALYRLLFLFRKKARSTLLFSCKRPHDGSLSLPPFYDITCLWHAETLDFMPFLHKFCKNTRTNIARTAEILRFLFLLTRFLHVLLHFYNFCTL